MEQPTNTTDTKGHKEIVPEVTWAQRSSTSDPERNYVFVTIVVPDVPADKLKLDIQPTSLDFTGYSNTRKATYHVKLDLFAEIEPKESKTNHNTRSVELVLRKKELNEEYWPRLLKEKGKVHFLKTDFDKWVDEDEQDAVPDDEDYMSRMGGAGAGGMPPGGMGGMEGMGGMGGEGFGGIDFSKLGGGAGGMPDFGGMDMSQMMANMGGAGGGEDEGDEEDDDDEDMPGLEGDKPAEGKSKIEEVE